MQLVTSLIVRFNPVSAARIIASRDCRRERPRKNWWGDIREDIRSIRQSVLVRHKCITKIRWQPANPGLPGKWPLNGVRERITVSTHP